MLSQTRSRPLLLPDLSNSVPASATSSYSHLSDRSPRLICIPFQPLTSTRSLSKGQQLQAFVVKRGSRAHTSVANHLVNFYSKCQRPHDALRAFEEIPVKSNSSWSSVISSFAQNELPELSLSFFRRMVANGVRPDDHIFPRATKCCAASSAPAAGCRVHSLAVKTGLARDVFAGSSLVDMFAKCDLMVYARSMLDEMPERDVVSWIGLISGYAVTEEEAAP